MAFNAYAYVRIWKEDQIILLSYTVAVSPPTQCFPGKHGCLVARKHQCNQNLLDTVKQQCISMQANPALKDDAPSSLYEFPLPRATTTTQQKKKGGRVTITHSLLDMLYLPCNEQYCPVKTNSHSCSSNSQFLAVA